VWYGRNPGYVGRNSMSYGRAPASVVPKSKRFGPINRKIWTNSGQLADYVNCYSLTFFLPLFEGYRPPFHEFIFYIKIQWKSQETGKIHEYKLSLVYKHSNKVFFNWSIID